MSAKKKIDKAPVKSDGDAKGVEGFCKSVQAGLKSMTGDQCDQLREFIGSLEVWW